MTGSVHVRAPCRLHFGMVSFGHKDRSQFGGVGVMISPPVVEVVISPAKDFVVSGSLSSRVEQFVRAAAKHWQLEDLPACRLQISSPPDHIGLGIGTQLGLSVAEGLRRFLQLPQLEIDELAASVGRGVRSAVGTYGFRLGGLIIDGGKKPSPMQTLGKLAQRKAIPDLWRFVVIRAAGSYGLAGHEEATAFASLPPVPLYVTRELWRIALEVMLPAVDRYDCTAFGEAVYQFGWLSGTCFTAVQGGPFVSENVRRLVTSIRNHGVPGVGQSSWGPTIFAITPNDLEAHALVEWLRTHHFQRIDEITIAHPNNHGVQVSID